MKNTPNETEKTFNLPVMNVIQIIKSGYSAVKHYMYTRIWDRFTVKRAHDQKGTCLKWSMFKRAKQEARLNWSGIEAKIIA